MSECQLHERDRFDSYTAPEHFDCPYCEISRLKAEVERYKTRFFTADAIAARYRQALDQIKDFAYDEPDCARIAREALEVKGE